MEIILNDPVLEILKSPSEMCSGTQQFCGVSALRFGSCTGLAYLLRVTEPPVAFPAKMLLACVGYCPRSVTVVQIF